jgi:hypothetical protein
MIHEAYFEGYDRVAALRRSRRRLERSGRCYLGSDSQEDAFGDNDVVEDDDDGEEEDQESSDEVDVEENSQDAANDSEDEETEDLPLNERYRAPTFGSGIDSPIQNVRNVAPSLYPDEIVVNQRGCLHAKLPMLMRASRQIFAETLSYYYKGEIKFIVHVNYCNVRRLFERRSIFRVLDDLCGIDTVTEENTMVVLHSVPVKDKIENLEYWLGKHWYDNSPLFDTNLHCLFKNQPSPTGGKSYGHTLLQFMR